MLSMEHLTSRGASRPSRTVFFDAGNTLLRMDYEVLAEQLRVRGFAATPERVREAEWRARVRLDAHFAPGMSTESRSTGGRYLRYLLDGLGVTDEETVRSIAE